MYSFSSEISEILIPPMKYSPSCLQKNVAPPPRQNFPKFYSPPLIPGGEHTMSLKVRSLIPEGVDTYGFYSSQR